MKPKSREPICLIGIETSQIFGAKLPSNRQVLSTLFYNLRTVHKDIRESANLVIKEVEVFWEKSSIPTRQRYNSVTKLINLYKEYRNITKNSKRTSDTQRNYENIFSDKLDNVFDIASADALESTNLEAKQFLIAQREPGRKGSLLGVDQKQVNKEKRSAERKQKEKNHKQKYEEAKKGKIFMLCLLILAEFFHFVRLCCCVICL